MPKTVPKQEKPEKVESSSKPEQKKEEEDKSSEIVLKLLNRFRQEEKPAPIDSSKSATKPKKVTIVE
jgi:hypothetical protein